jgi:hypothetical protein
MRDSNVLFHRVALFDLRARRSPFQAKRVVKHHPYPPPSLHLHSTHHHQDPSLNEYTKSACINISSGTRTQARCTPKLHSLTGRIGRLMREGTRSAHWKEKEESSDHAQIAQKAAAAARKFADLKDRWEGERLSAGAMTSPSSLLPLRMQERRARCHVRLQFLKASGDSTPRDFSDASASLFDGKWRSSDERRPA